MPPEKNTGSAHGAAGVVYVGGMSATQMLLWETVVTPAGDGRAMVARRPVVARRLSTRETLRVLRGVAGEISDWQIRRWVADGTLEATKPGAVGHALQCRRDGRKSNAKLQICAASVARLAEKIGKREGMRPEA